jgi:hypothetical protein
MQLLGSFVQAEYPEEARAKGTEATVVLRLSIDSTGRRRGRPGRPCMCGKTQLPSPRP